MLPTAAFVIANGLLGLTTKLALRSVEWQELVMWSALAYGVAALVLLAVGRGSLRWVSDTPWAIVSGILPVIGLAMFFLAINNAEVSRVVPITSAYPLVTVLLALLFLNEAFTVPRGLGILLVVCGVALLSR